jgi:hypothetical protein
MLAQANDTIHDLGERLSRAEAQYAALKAAVEGACDKAVNDLDDVRQDRQTDYAIGSVNGARYTRQLVRAALAAAVPTPTEENDHDRS